MSIDPAKPANPVPADDDLDSAFRPYISAVGSVIHASNQLQEFLGQLFVAVTGISRDVALAVWYSSRSDGAQRLMLRAAASATSDDRWGKQLPKAKEDLVWLVDEASTLAEHRNDAAHAPVSLAIDQGALIPLPYYFHGNPRAIKLKNKDIIAEFARCQTSANLLREFAGQIESALHFPASYPWPDRPSLPESLQKNVPQAIPTHQARKAPRVRRRRSSRA